MNPEDVWDAYAAKFGHEIAVQKLGERPGAPHQPPTITYKDTPAEGTGRLARTGRFLRGALSAYTQGGTLNLADEAAGGLAGIAAMVPGGQSPAEAVRSTIEAERESAKRFRKEHPALSFGAEMTGGVATGLAAGKALSAGKGAEAGGKAVARGLGRTVAESAGVGAVTGAGASEGGAKQRARGAAVGGTAGAIFGAATYGAGKVLGRFLDVFGLRPRGSAPAAEGAAEAADQTAPAAPEETAGRFARRVKNAAGSVIESADDRANRKVLEAMARDRVGPEDVRGLAQTSNKPVTIMDVGDPEGSVVGLGQATRSIPGPAKARLSERFRTRAEGAFGRIQSDLEDATGLQREFTPKLAEDIVAERAQKAAPLYEAAYAHGEVDDPVIRELMKKPSIQQAFGRAKAIAAEEGDPTMAMVDLGARPPDVKTLDYIKRGLDDMLYVGKRSTTEGGLGPTHLREIAKTRTALLDRLDEVVPAYAEARAQYAGDTALRDALEQGRARFLLDDPRQIVQDLAGMSEGEQQMYRRGGIDAVMSMLGKKSDTSNIASKLEGTPDVRARVRALFDTDEAAASFLKKLGLESRMSQSRAAFGNSQTAEKLAAQADLLEEGRALPTYPTLWGTAMRGLGTVARGAQRRFSSKVSESLADKLSSSGPDLERVLRELEGYSARQVRRGAAAQAARVGATEAVTSGTLRSLLGER